MKVAGAHALRQGVHAVGADLHRKSPLAHEWEAHPRNFPPLDPPRLGMVWYFQPNRVARWRAGLGEHTHWGEEY